MKVEVDTPNCRVPLRLVVKSAQLIEAIQALLDQDSTNPYQIGDDAVVEVRIPGGGDYSGENINVNEFTIRWIGEPL